jgi:predicted component of type VI protein secretion system
MNSMIDLRSNPAARQQVQAIVRRAASTAQPAAAQPAAATPVPAAAAPPASAPSYVSAPEVSTAQRLQELETLRATGAISDDEYSAKRQQIISDL